MATLAPLLQRDVKLNLVGEEPPSPPAADVNVYHVDDDPAHGYVYQALLRDPGVVVLEEWGLHRLVHAETAGRGDEGEYEREARHSHGELGTFVARQVVRGLGGALPGAFLRMNERVLAAGRGFVATGAAVHERLAARCPHRPVVHLPLAFQAPPQPHGNHEARSQLGVSPEGLLVIAVRPRGAPTPPAGVARALEEVRAAEPRVAVRWVGEGEPDIAVHIAAADVVVALDQPLRLGLGSAVPLAMDEGKAVLVSAGSGIAREMPDGVVAHVSPGSSEVAEAVALVRRLLGDEPLRARMGRLARSHAGARHDPEGTARVLLDLLESVGPTSETRGVRPVARSSNATWALNEIGVAARELGLANPPPGLASLTDSLFEEDDR